MTASRTTPESRREAWLSLGRALFAEQPYEAVSIDQIADRAGVSRGLLYHSFGSKRGFYLEVMRSAAEALLRATAPPEQGDPLDAVLQGFLEWEASEPALFRALVRGTAGADPEVSAIVEAVREACAARLLEVVGGGSTPARRARALGWVGFAEALVLASRSQAPVARAGVHQELRRAAELLFSEVPCQEQG
jgi:AcrR family transcriptional regulator